LAGWLAQTLPSDTLLMIWLSAASFASMLSLITLMQQLALPLTALDAASVLLKTGLIF
jgi:hypothetical protein